MGESIDVVAQATQPADLTLSINGEEVASEFGLSLSYPLSLDNTGDYVLDIVASADGSTVHSSATVFVMPESAPVLAPPAGVVDGINELNDSTVVLQWTAPYKDFVFVVGDWNDWSVSESSMMHAAGDGETFWLEIGGLTPGESYRYQYQILPDDIRVADAYAEVILDQWNDPWIPESTYPNLLPYPANETTGPVSVLTPGEPEFAWTDQDFERPDQENLCDLRIAGARLVGGTHPEVH